ncbi:tRNA ligase [Entomortierella parvispora]|uniref:tRNA ligase n=1 Tax=Entomortierella parvispora TaxID=205924 RepID=A0A9P3H4F6_9FUNG|nr:tRNA ligase [Entomortierella parvispora]
MTDQLPQQPQDQSKTRSRNNDETIAAEQAKADALIRELHDCAENKPQGENGPKRRRNLVYANKFEIPLPPQNGHHKNNDSDGKNTLEVISWRLNEFEYSKGTLPTLARGLFTYQDKDAPSRNQNRPSDNNNGPNMDHPSPGSSIDGAVSPQPYSHILIRGYDKFFNIGEVAQTKLDYLEAETTGPYEVTLKENGCIIFMAGLPPHLVGQEGGCVVSSKHNLGTIEQQQQKFGEVQQGSNDSDGQHPVKGREWLERNLAAKGKTVQEFGLWLWNNNLTAVAELCDDSFEEHILEYTGERAGLYLHGLNRNTANFQTLPSEQVQQAAEHWGFQRVDYITCKSFQEVMTFAEKVRNAGEYDNRAVEGFVVRAQHRNNGHVQFFKIKYDEPYLMYREWREVTKHIWSVESKREATEQKQKAAAEVRAKMIAEGKAQSKKAKESKAGGSTATPKAATTPGNAPEVAVMPRRMKYPLTRPYVDFVYGLMKTQPELFRGYNKNHGIIAIRDMFIKHWESKPTKEQEALITATTTTSSSSSSSKVTREDFQRTVIIPIATIGCGKTTVSVSLNKLFGWTHVSSDDFQHIRKNPGPKFVREIVNQLRTHMVVIADRNNHEYLHRERLMNAVLEEFPKTRFVALYWSHDDLPSSKIHEMEVERVKDRGSNHQNLTPEYCPEFEHVINVFLRAFNPLNPMVAPDSQFSNVVESKFGEESLVFVQRIVKEFAIPTLGAGGLGNHSVPSDEEIVEAVRFAREDWKPARVASGEAEKFHKEKQLTEMRLASKDNLLTSDNNQTSPGNGGSVAFKGRKVREPKYYAVSLEASSVLHFLEEQFEQRDLPIEKSSGHITGPKDAHWLQFQRQLQTWKDTHRIGQYQHVTLVHTSARKNASPQKAKRAEDLWQKYTQELAGGPSLSSSPSTSLPASPLETFTSTMSQALPSIDDSATATADTEDAFIPVVRRRDRHGRKSAPAVPTTTTTAANSAASSLPTPPAATVTTPLAGEGADDGLSDLHSTVVVDYLVWTERIAILRVSDARRTRSGEGYETVQSMLHITVGTVDDQVKPYESNDVLRLWSERMKHGDEKAPTGPEIFSIKLDKAKVFTGHLKGMMF